jgi:GT2 family glycosyltransferase
MLTLAPAPVADTASTHLDLFRLGGSVFLLCWTLDAPSAAGRPAITLASRGRRLPSASVTLQLADGRERMAVAFRYGGHDGVVANLSHRHAADAVTAGFDPAVIHAMAEPAEILRDLAPKSRLALANALVGAWPTLFGLTTTTAYLSFLRQFLLALSPKPVPAVPVATLVEGKVLLETVLPGAHGTVRAAHRIDGAGLSRLACRPRLGPPDRAGRRQLHLVVDDAPVRGSAVLVLQTESGLVVRALQARQPTPSLGRWWASKASARDGLRNWLVEQLAGLSEQGRQLAIEMQRRLPLAVQNVRRNDDLPSAELDLALCNEAGLLLGGWYRDPDNLLEQVLLHRSDAAPLSILGQIERFPAMLAVGSGPEKRPATGFAGLVPGFAAGAPVLQPRCELRLKSGTSLFLRPPVQPADVATIRARALAAIPPQHLTATMLERTLAPVLAACQGELRDSLPEPAVKTLGQPLPCPLVSVVVPLYRVYEFLRVQVAAFAGDGWFAANAELIYVLDSPEHEAEVAHLLGGLHLAYGLPLRLAVMGRNGGFSAACNAGARLARGETLALVNSDVIPAGEGWLPALIRRLDRRGRIGAVGPKLLYDDGSLQHAGLFFQRDTRGVWLNHHYFKGMPGGYGPANVERPVPGVTGACILLSRSLFLEIGGFDDGYVIGDYEDSDLCLKIRRAGLGILYVPGVALYHLERQSISKSADYTRGVASQHNAWLQTRRWDVHIERLMAEMDSAGLTPPVREPEILPRANLRRATAA